MKEKITNGMPRWIVAYGHRPLYTSARSGSDVPNGNYVLQGLVEDLLIDNKVDLVLQAHVHSYERTWPLKHNTTAATSYAQPPAPVYVVNGAAGNREKNQKLPGMPWQPKNQPFDSTVSFGIFTVTHDSIKWEQYASVNGSVIDSFEITKD